MLIFKTEKYVFMAKWQLTNMSPKSFVLMFQINDKSSMYIYGSSTTSLVSKGLEGRNEFINKKSYFYHQQNPRSNYLNSHVENLY